MINSLQQLTGCGLSHSGPSLSACLLQRWPTVFGGFLSEVFTPFITSAINFYYGYVSVRCLVLMYFYVSFFDSETKDLSLEEVEEMWHEGVLPWKSQSWVSPTKRTAEYDADELDNDEKPWYKQMV
ncbi:Hexose transporter 2 [Lachancea thermotolerans]